MHNALLLRISLCVLVFQMAFPIQAPISENRVYVGFLDDAREEMVNWKPGVSKKRVIRPAFERTRLGWKDIDSSSLPPQMKWTIAFDGRNLGQIESQPDSNGGLTPVQKIVTPLPGVPTIASPSPHFAGLIAVGPGRVRRPLVAISKPYFHDPDGWKRAKLPDDIAEIVRQAFRRDYPHVDRCKDEEVVERDWKFPDSALALPIVYASNKHSFLIQSHLNAGDCGYVDDADDPLADPWFFVSTERTVRRIGGFMSLVEAGDYDNDGTSEVVLFTSQGENTDGFVLFDSRLEKQAALVWHYH